MSQPFLNENPEGRQFAGPSHPWAESASRMKWRMRPSSWQSDEARLVTGSAYNVDGGWTAGMTKALALI